MFQHHSRQTAVLWNKLSQQRTGLEILRTLVAKCYVYDWNIKHCRTQFMAICVLFILLLGWTLSNKAIWKIVIFLFIIYEGIWCIFYFMSSSQSFILVLVQLKTPWIYLCLLFAPYFPLMTYIWLRSRYLTITNYFCTDSHIYVLQPTNYNSIFKDFGDKK